MIQFTDVSGRNWKLFQQLYTTFVSKNDVLKLHANPPIPKYVEAQLHKPKVENSSGSCSGSKSKQQNSRR